MIKINLLLERKAFRMPVILGFDLGLLNFKWIIFVVIFHFIALPIIKGRLDSEIKLTQEEFNKTSSFLRELQKKESDLALFSDLALKLEKNEVALKEKLEVIKKIIKFKKNPDQLMLYIAKNIPEDVWIEEMNLENESLVIVAYSKSYKSIGIFIEKLKKSIFFENSVRLESSKTITSSSNSYRYEAFTLAMSIVRYN